MEISSEHRELTQAVARINGLVDACWEEIGRVRPDCFASKALMEALHDLEAVRDRWNLKFAEYDKDVTVKKGNEMATKHKRPDEVFTAADAQLLYQRSLGITDEVLSRAVLDVEQVIRDVAMEGDSLVTNAGMFVCGAETQSKFWRRMMSILLEEEFALRGFVCSGAMERSQVTIAW